MKTQSPLAFPAWPRRKWARATSSLSASACKLTPSLSSALRTRSVSSHTEDILSEIAWFLQRVISLPSFSTPVMQVEMVACQSTKSACDSHVWACRLCPFLGWSWARCWLSVPMAAHTEPSTSINLWRSRYTSLCHTCHCNLCKKATGLSRLSRMLLNACPAPDKEGCIHQALISCETPLLMHVLASHAPGWVSTQA